VTDENPETYLPLWVLPVLYKRKIPHTPHMVMVGDADMEKKEQGTAPP
jgi:hypothetical protein